jgi:hypothetical protein
VTEECKECIIKDLATRALEIELKILENYAS